MRPVAAGGIEYFKCFKIAFMTVLSTPWRPAFLFAAAIWKFEGLLSDRRRARLLRLHRIVGNCHAVRRSGNFQIAQPFNRREDVST
jgi:hypothetical protein